MFFFSFLFFPSSFFQRTPRHRPTVHPTDSLSLLNLPLSLSSILSLSLSQTLSLSKTSLSLQETLPLSIPISLSLTLQIASGGGWRHARPAAREAGKAPARRGWWGRQPPLSSILSFPHPVEQSGAGAAPGRCRRRQSSRAGGRPRRPGSRAAARKKAQQQPMAAAAASHLEEKPNLGCGFGFDPKPDPFKPRSDPLKVYFHLSPCKFLNYF